MNLKARLRAHDEAPSRLIITDGRRQLTRRQLLDVEPEIDDTMAAGGVALCLGSAYEFVSAIGALDGRVSRLLLLSPDLAAAEIKTLLATAKVSRLLSDRHDLTDFAQPPQWTAKQGEGTVATTWLMTTSGTTGTPKIVAHSIESLTTSVKLKDAALAPIWGLLYEPSRFAGLQVILQSLLGNGTLVTPDRSLDVADQLEILSRNGCTHLSGTPSLWRKLLLSPVSEKLALRQITLGGETSDARVLKSLRDSFPKARVTQIYASTEAGVGFSNHDGKPGFPAECLVQKAGQPDFRIKDGELWARPNHHRMLADKEFDAEGYFNTGDSVEVVEGRLFFRGRRDAVANVGGIKIRVEDVETVVRENDQVLDCQVVAKASPILGTILTLHVVARDSTQDPSTLKTAIAEWCRSRLPREACPASIRIVSSLEMNAAGKVSRRP